MRLFAYTFIHNFLFNSDILKGCHSRHFYLDLYNITEGKLSFLYDDLVPAESGYTLPRLRIVGGQ